MDKLISAKRYNLEKLILASIIFIYPNLDYINVWYVDGIKKVFGFLLVAYAIVMMYSRRLENEHETKDYKLLKKYYILFMIFGSFSIFYAQDKVGVIKEVIGLLSYGAMYYIVYNYIKNKEKLNEVINIFVLSMVVPLIIGVVQAIFRSGTMYYGQHRVIGTLGHTSTYGHYLVMIGILFLAMVLSQSKLIKIRVSIILGISSMILLFLTYTRVSWINFAICTALMIMIFFRKYLKKIILCLIPIAIIFLPKIYQRFAAEMNIVAKNSIHIGPFVFSGSYASRMHFMIFGIKNMFLRSPIIGLGLGAFFYTYSYPNFGLEVEMHNDFAKLLAETGIIGFALYILIIFYIIKIFVNYLKTNYNSQNIFENKYNVIVVAGLFVTLSVIFGQIIDVMFRLQAVMWTFAILIGISMSIIYKIQDDR